MKSRRAWTLALAFGVAASVAVGQNADPNSGGPTKNTYRLRLVEPADGATIVGETFQVVVDLRTTPEVGGDKKDTNSMPRPRVDVYIDNEHQGTLQEEQNVMMVTAPPGSHKLVVLAKNRSGEIIDRKEVGITLERGTATAMAPAVAPPPAPAPPRVDTSATSTVRTDSSASSSYRSEPPAQAPPPPAPARVAPAPAPAPERPQTLPETATIDPLLVLSGAVLAVMGLAMRRRARV